MHLHDGIPIRHEMTDGEANHWPLKVEIRIEARIDLFGNNIKLYLAKNQTWVEQTGKSWRKSKANTVDYYILPKRRLQSTSMTNQVTQVITGLDFLPLPRANYSPLSPSISLSLLSISRKGPILWRMGRPYSQSRSGGRITCPKPNGTFCDCEIARGK